jgi:hypothetical protein
MSQERLSLTFLAHVAVHEDQFCKVAAGKGFDVMQQELLRSHRGFQERHQQRLRLSGYDLQEHVVG